MDFEKLTKQELQDFLNIVPDEYTEISKDKSIPLVDRVSLIFSLAESTSNMRYTEPIVDLYRATKIKNILTDATTYRTQQILNLSGYDLNMFAQIFKLTPEEATPVRILRILKLMDRIDDLEPEDLEELEESQIIPFVPPKPRKVFSEETVPTRFTEEILQMRPVLSAICQRLTFKEVNQLRVNSNLKNLNCDFPITDPDSKLKNLNQVNATTNRLYNNIQKYGSQRALSLAARQGYLDDVKYLVSHGVDLEKSDSQKITALISAASGGSLEIVNYLLEKGVNPLSTGRIGWSPLIVAVEKNHQDVVRRLLEVIPITTRNKQGKTVLMIAAEYGHIDLVKFLLSQEFSRGPSQDPSQSLSIDDRDNEGMTALMLAAENKHFDIVKLLLQHKAQTNVHNSEFQSSLLFAIRQKNIEMVKLLLQHGAAHIDEPKMVFKTIRKAVIIDSPEILQNILEEFQANPSGLNYLTMKNTDQVAILLEAIGLKLKEMVQILLKYGADPNVGFLQYREATRPYFTTPLMRAIDLNAGLEILELLILFGAEINARDEFGRTALRIAVDRGSLETVKFLVEHGANPNISTSTLSPLKQAIKLGHHQIIKYLKEVGAR